MRKPLIWTVALLAALAFAWMLLARDGGCDRTPPDDDEPVRVVKMVFIADDDAKDAD